MQAYIFLVIAVLLIIKPSVNAQFLSELGVEQLPFAFLAVAFTAIFSSFFYSRALTKFSLNKIIEVTLLVSIVILVGLGMLLKLNVVGGWILYFFYVWVAIYAVLTASQFWVLANLVFNLREAKRLFGLIGSGAILGGIFGGYLTSFLAPLIGNENLIFLAATLLICCIPLLRKIWRLRVKNLGVFKEKKRTLPIRERPFRLIRNSKHLSYMASIVAVSVLVAKLVDYLFSDFASASLADPDELTSFFGFWFSTFNLLALAVQLFFTQRIVGIWGVGFSLLLLPIGIFAGSVVFFILPELSVVIVIKAMDGILKQSVHKSAVELLALPLPFDLKNRTKSFIDVVVDSIATGIAGFLLIFVVQGLELSSFYIVGLIILLVLIWIFFIGKVRIAYYLTFRNNLEAVTERSPVPEKSSFKQASVIQGMRTVFQNGTEEQILFMLVKLMEVNDIRFEKDVQQLLNHTSTKVRTAAIQNLYFLNSKSMVTEISGLLNTEDEVLTLATLEYLLLCAGKNSNVVFDVYLDHPNKKISEAALYCLAREARDNPILQSYYRLKERVGENVSKLGRNIENIPSLKILLKTIGAANLEEFYPVLSTHFESPVQEVKETAISAAGISMDASFVSELISFLPDKKLRPIASAALRNYGRNMITVLSQTVKGGMLPIETLRFIPAVIKGFASQEAVKHLFILIKNPDLTLRLETIRALSDIRRNRPELKFNKYKVVALIFEECQLYHRTLSAMHTQIIISYRNRKKSHKEISQEEQDARTSLLELLERRLDAGLERIFKLLGLKYEQKDVEIAYEGLLNEKQEARVNAIEFLDNLLTGDLKRTLLPIIEESALDISSEEVVRKIKHKVPTEMQCFQLLLDGNDLKVKLAVLYLIKKQQDLKYLPMVRNMVKNENLKLRTFAKEAVETLEQAI